MNNHEWLMSQKDLKVLGHELCQLNDIVNNDCEKCMAKKYCSVGKNGFIAWLEEKRTEYVDFFEERGFG